MNIRIVTDTNGIFGACVLLAKNGNSKDSNKADDSKDDEADEAIPGKALGEIAVIEKFITQTKIDGLQTLYTVNDDLYSSFRKDVHFW